MAITESQKQSQKKYLEKFEDVKLRVPKGERKVIQEHAAMRGESVSAFIKRAIEQQIVRDNEENERK